MINISNEKEISMCDTGVLVNSKAIRMSVNDLYGLNPS